MKWQIWVEPNQIFVEDFPNGWTHSDVKRAANNRYGGKVTTVGPAPVGGSSDDDDNEGGGFDFSGGATLWIVGIIAFIFALPYLIPIAVFGLIGWGGYKLIKWILK